MDNRTERQKYDDWAEKEEFITTSLELQAGWLAWQAAKHDAKPIAEFHHCKYSDNSEYWVLVDGSDLGKQFYNKKEGEEYAIANGYRLE